MKFKLVDWVNWVSTLWVPSPLWKVLEPPTWHPWPYVEPKKQESPAAWTQEGYRPPRSKCLLCCSVSWWGYPHPAPMRGYPNPIQTGDTPNPVLTRGTPISQMRVPTLEMMGYPQSGRIGVPIPVGRDGGYPFPPHHQLDGGTPYPVMMYKVKTLPSVILWMRMVIINVWLIFRNVNMSTKDIQMKLIINHFIFVVFRYLGIFIVHDLFVKIFAINLQVRKCIWW